MVNRFVKRPSLIMTGDHGAPDSRIANAVKTPDEL